MIVGVLGAGQLGLMLAQAAGRLGCTLRFISPDEQYIIYCAERPDGYGKGDLFISFKDGKGQWQAAKNMGNAVNTSGYEFCPFVSADGKHLFFSRDGDIYWVDAQVIKTLR